MRAGSPLPTWPVASDRSQGAGTPASRATAASDVRWRLTALWIRLAAVVGTPGL